MRAVVMRNKTLALADVPEPAPEAGEALVRTLACGICGSDLHALKHADRFVEASRRAGNALDPGSNGCRSRLSTCRRRLRKSRRCWHRPRASA
jgi:hypothetical protein